MEVEHHRCRLEARAAAAGALPNSSPRGSNERPHGGTGSSPSGLLTRAAVRSPRRPLSSVFDRATASPERPAIWRYPVKSNFLAMTAPSARARPLRACAASTAARRDAKIGRLRSAAVAPDRLRRAPQIPDVPATDGTDHFPAVGDEQVRGHERVETRFRSRACIRPVSTSGGNEALQGTGHESQANVGYAIPVEATQAENLTNRWVGPDAMVGTARRWAVAAVVWWPGPAGPRTVASGWCGG
jgi:hypothetical protein